MLAKKLPLPQEEKIKYVLNGETRYYTMDELREYYKELLEKNDVYYPDCFDRVFEMLLETLEKFDGDPYGYLPEESRKFDHQFEARGYLYVHRPYIRIQDTA